MRLKVLISRWRCHEPGCIQKIFMERPPGVAGARRVTERAADVITLIGHALGGRPAARLAARLGLRVSRQGVLNSLRHAASAPPTGAETRVVGIDDWAWKKGSRYGTIIVDLERREVLDVLPDREASTTEAWLNRHPGVEYIARDRDGVYAEGARHGAPNARQVADRFHILQNLRMGIERELSGVRAPRKQRSLVPRADRRPWLRKVPRHQVREPETGQRIRIAGETMRRELYQRVSELFDQGYNISEIARELGISRRTVDHWVRLDEPPVRRAMAPKAASARGHLDYLRMRWNEGCRHAGKLFQEIQAFGFKGSYQGVARFLSPWRESGPPPRDTEAAGERPGTECAAPSQRVSPETPPSAAPLPHDPFNGCRISPVVAAALCIKPSGMLTERQAARVDVLKRECTGFAVMRALVMRFRGMMRGGGCGKLDTWIRDAMESGIHAMRRFASGLKRDLSAVRNALATQWSSGQVEGQVNRLKTLKRSMYGRCGIEILRARMLPCPV